MYILKIGAIEGINTSVTNIPKISQENTDMLNVLNCRITSITKINAKLCTIFQTFGKTVSLGNTC